MGFNVSDFVALFGGRTNTNTNDKSSNRWEVVCEPKLPKGLVILTNLIDMAYNYLSGSGYHTTHFSDLNNIRANSCGFIAIHMFAEYLSRKDETGKFRMTYEDAIKAVADNNTILTQDDWYIGTALASTTWRQAAVYRDRCTEGDWLRPFNLLYEENGEALLKDYVQLRMCAKLLLWNSPYLKDLNERGVNSKGERQLTINDFPKELRSFIEELDKVKQLGGGSRKTKKTATKKSTKKVMS